jgi:2-isopropylmalate synthase
VRLRIKDEVREAAAVGDGPVDAACKAIAQLTNTSAKMVRYEIRAVTSGTGAMGEVTVQLEGAAGRKVMDRGARPT